MNDYMACGACGLPFLDISTEAERELHVEACAKKHERINHPAHYGGDTTYEAIKVIDAWRLGFALGNAVKYIARAGKKDAAKTIEDLEKAAWYLARHIEKLKESK